MLKTFPDPINIVNRLVSLGYIGILSAATEPVLIPCLTRRILSAAIIRNVAVLIPCLTRRIARTFAALARMSCFP